MENLYILGQVLLGLYFVMAGAMHFMKSKMMVDFMKTKNMPAPMPLVLLSGLVLLAGGLSVLTGRYLEYGLWLLVGFLLVVSFTMHAFWKDKDAEKKMMNMHYFQSNIALMAALLMLMPMMSNWPWVL
jgi:uncharacterized membrane protein YphA (DoxX/SURF4 family)